MQTQTNPARRKGTRQSVFAMLAVLTIVGVFTAQKMAQPEQANAQAIVAYPLAEGITYAIFGTTATAVVIHAVQQSDAPQVARRAIAHPNRFPALVKWAHKNQSRGQNVWQNVGGSRANLKDVWHWFRRHYTLRGMKNKAPGAGIACVLSGLYTWGTSGSFGQGLRSCIGAAIGVFGVPGAKVAPSTPGIVARLEAAAR